MRDIKYLTEVYNTLDEAIGIKSTILLPFYKNANSYDSQRNPASSHGEIDDKMRRFVKYDYGKANYEEISAEEAIQYVKQDKYNIQNLRIILDKSDKSSLLEYEIRDNGNPYAIYRPTDVFELNGKEFKNVGYITGWKNIFELFKLADVIYKTDEYAHALSNDFRSDRIKKGKVIKLTSPKNPGDFGYNAYAHDHNLTNYANMYGDDYESDAQRFGVIDLDTGAHNPKKSFKPISSFEWGYFNQYFDCKEEVKKQYERLDKYRRALKKLEREKEDLDIEVYAKKYDTWLGNYRSALSDYKEATQQLKRIKDKTELALDEKSAAFAEKLKADIKKVSELNDRIADYKDSIDILSKQKLIDSNLYAYRDIVRALNNQASELVKVKATLQDAEQNLEDVQAGNNEQQSLEELDQKIDSFNDALATYEQRNVQELQAYLDSIESRLSALKSTVDARDKLRPKAAAARAEKAAKNAKKELDPYLVDILDFGDNN